jgi:ABC-type amino acid transport system permease subunit
VAGASALLLGFSFPVWAVAVDVEVYSLTLVLVLLLWLGAESADRGGPLLILAYLAGIALTNHMSAASTVLGVVLAVVIGYRREFVRRIPFLFLLFLVGVSPYLFLVLRARAGPLFAWGNPYNLERFYWHVTGRQYQVWMFSESFGEVLRNAGRGAALLARSFVYVLVPVVFYGAVRLFRQRRSLAIGLALSAVLAFAYAVNYSIPDIESYYMPCLVALAVFGMFGLDGLAGRIGKWRHAAWLAGILALLLNFRVASKQGDYVAYDQAMNTLGSAEQNATIITDWWDVYSPVFYLQHVEQARPDVCVIDKELLRRSWYFKYLARAYPWLAERSAAEIAQYREYLDQFEHNRLRDPGEIQRRYMTMLASFVTRNPERLAYTTFDANASLDAKQMLAGAHLVPVGLLFQIRDDAVLPEFDYRRLTARIPRHEPDERTRDVLERYQYFLRCRVQALVNSRREAEAKPLLDWYRSLPVSRLVPLPVRE